MLRIASYLKTLPLPLGTHTFSLVFAPILKCDRPMQAARSVVIFHRLCPAAAACEQMLICVPIHLEQCPTKFLLILKIPQWQKLSSNQRKFHLETENVENRYNNWEK
jgi:hypothetical protein